MHGYTGYTASEAMASECIDRFRVGCPASRAYMRGPWLNARSVLSARKCVGPIFAPILQRTYVE
jgi:hypothetical protein